MIAEYIRRFSSDLRVTARAVEPALSREAHGVRDSVVIIAEIFQLALKVSSIPEEHVIQIFTPYRTDEAFEEGM